MGKHKKKRKKTRRDTAEIARSVVEQAIGETLAPREKEPEEQPKEDTRNQAAVALSKLGASKGGKARAKKLTARQRSTIARNAAQIRWEIVQEQKRAEEKSAKKAKTKAK